jgi:hypothetical protein
MVSPSGDWRLWPRVLVISRMAFMEKNKKLLRTMAIGIEKTRYHKSKTAR